MKEAKQLNLFDWQPKQSDAYDGLSDTDKRSWFNVSFLKEKYREYNHRFFDNKLPSAMPIEINNRSIYGNTLGSCSIVKHPKMDDVSVEKIVIANKEFVSRFYLEDTLLHEMCHVYQIHVLCRCRLSELAADDVTSKGDKAHGIKFFEAAKLVNNSSDNREGFKITQYSDENQTRTRKMNNTEGWLLVNPHILWVDIRMFANTSTGRGDVLNYDSSLLYTYSDGHVKAQIYQWIGRKNQSYYYKNWIKDICNMINNKKLVKLSPSRGDIKIIYGESEEGTKYLISTNDIEKSIQNNRLVRETVQQYNLAHPFVCVQNDIAPYCVALKSGLLDCFSRAVQDGTLERVN